MLLFFFPTLTFFFMTYPPATVQLSFATASAMGVLQSRTLQNPMVREWLGIAPIIKKPSPSRSLSAPKSATPALPTPTYQAPTVRSMTTNTAITSTDPAAAGSNAVKTTAAGKAKGVYDGAKKEWSGMVTEMRSSVAKYTGSGGVDEAVRPRKSAAFLRQAAEFEQTRQEELLYRRREWRKELERKEELERRADRERRRRKKRS